MSGTNLVCAPGELMLMMVRAMAPVLEDESGELPSWFAPKMYVEDW